MNFLKDAKMCAITSAVLCIVLGLLFLLFPEMLQFGRKHFRSFLLEKACKPGYTVPVLGM